MRASLVLSIALAAGLVGCRLGRPVETGPGASPPTSIPTLVPSAKPGTVPITPATASIKFTGSTALMSQSGNFAAFDGALEANSLDPRAAKIRVVVNMDSVTTRIGRLTKHLKAEDFFDVARFPTAEFVSESITSGSDTGQVTVMGRLTLHGVTKPISFPARFVLSDEEVTFSGTMNVRQSEFGMTEAARVTKDEVPVVVSVRGRR